MKGMFTMTVRRSKLMKLAQIHCFVRTSNDTIDTASGSTLLVVPQPDAVPLATHLFRHGDADYLHSSPERAIVAGHPILIEYASGRTRRVFK